MKIIIFYSSIFDCSQPARTFPVVIHRRWSAGCRTNVVVGGKTFISHRGRVEKARSRANFGTETELPCLLPTAARRRPLLKMTWRDVWGTLPQRWGWLPHGDVREFQLIESSLSRSFCGKCDRIWLGKMWRLTLFYVLLEEILITGYNVILNINLYWAF